MSVATFPSAKMILVQETVLYAYTGLASLDYRWGFN